jgi:hypothetical protein
MAFKQWNHIAPDRNENRPDQRLQRIAPALDLFDDRAGGFTLSVIADDSSESFKAGNRAGVEIDIG